MDRIFSTLVGLTGACNNNGRTADTDDIMVYALTFPLQHPNAAEKEILQLIKKIKDIKYTISPSCATCANPCGNTSDFDLEKLYQADEQTRQLKMEILSNLMRLASQITSLREQENTSNAIDSFNSSHKLDFLYKGVSYLSYDLSEKSLHDLLMESHDMLLPL